jgi:HSP20 family protein
MNLIKTQSSFLQFIFDELNISTLNDNQTSEYNYNIQEFNYSSFNKSYDLPESIDLEKVDSLYRNGILSITLPKRKEYQSIPKKIISVKK